MKWTFLFFIFITISASSFGQNFNRPVPYGVYPYEYVENDTVFNFHISVNQFHRTPSTNPPDYNYHRGIIFDPDGYIAWYQEPNPSGAAALNNLHYNADHQEFLETVIYGAGQMSFTTLDTLFQFTDSVNTVGVLPDSHESHKAANGDHFVITKSDSIFDLSGYTIMGGPGNASTSVRCNGIQGFDSNGNLIFDWNSCDHVHPSEAYGFNYNVNQFDYYHMNSVDVTEDGNLISSGRHINAVVKIDQATGNVIWRLGGANSDFTFVGDQGFSGQHDARDLGNGLISIFDNGNLANPNRSRGVIYQLDTLNWTATLVSSFDPGVYGRAMGSHRKIGDYGVVGYGNIYRPNPNIQVYDANYNIAAEYYFTDSVQSYRALPFDMDFSLPRPTIYCFDSLGQTYIKADAAFSSYEWSTGETTQAILPTLGETYQVYVPWGVGRVGSYPLTYDGNCFLNLTALEHNEPTIIKTVDLLGRTVRSKTAGSLYIDMFSDGKSKLYYHTEN